MTQSLLEGELSRFITKETIYSFDSIVTFLTDRKGQGYKNLARDLLSNSVGYKKEHSPFIMVNMSGTKRKRL
eukprot:CAMPEP_0206206338 /NCGR_PEP_ID=MMETSP0166-20121206/14855_1 /ASSEMBLY_ACC=CAM_ASM_000260 /TAXON_ID=95228 /ORGANISM="Vannella robusta, Strain DIVA3 518/3/11/1/6" /LENGTH=71 /DNA_ID=CAMNT_0053626727 /DNA_START=521 /DNA_END=733 /DNA_ORIENTATION=-